MSDEPEKKLKREEEGSPEIPTTPTINNKRSFREFLRRDFVYICLLLFALLACLLTINNSLVIQNECNERWENQLRAANIILDPNNDSEFMNLPNIDYGNPELPERIKNLEFFNLS